MKNLLNLLIAGFCFALADAAWARSADTAWKDYASELPSDVRERLQGLRSSSASAHGEHRSTEVAKDAKLERERFLQSLPEAERERLRQKIRQLEERSGSSQVGKGFRDK